MQPPKARGKRPFLNSELCPKVQYLQIEVQLKLKLQICQPAQDVEASVFQKSHVWLNLSHLVICSRLLLDLNWRHSVLQQVFFR